MSAYKLKLLNPISYLKQESQLFENIIQQKQITTLFQPVLSLNSTRTLGWTAYSRGPDNSSLHNPERLFDYAQKNNSLPALEAVCLFQAISNCKNLESGQKIFINLSPSSLNQTQLSAEKINQYLTRYELKPENIVLEFNCNESQQELEFLLSKLELYRKLGFSIGLNHCGQNSLDIKSLCSFLPDFIKIDMSMTQDIESDPFKRISLETLVFLARKIKSVLIAQGIEAESQLNALAAIGVQAGQGFKISLPQKNCQKPDINPPFNIRLEDIDSTTLKCSMPIREITRQTLTVSNKTSVGTIKKMLADLPPMSSVVVLEKRKPLGLIMNYELSRKLSTQYGQSLYLQKPVTCLMRPNPLIVESHQVMEDVAKLATSRGEHTIYDDIIVIDQGIYLGTVSVQNMLDNMARLHVELAKGTNPLTGLPGNITIDQEIKQRIQKKLTSSFIYVDLDNFKVYNDVYGFKCGDKAILLTAHILKKSIDKDQQTFIGHVGGDDFIVISSQEQAVKICEHIIKEFNFHVPALYNEKDREKGYITSKNREGKPAKFPLLSVSLAIVDCDFHYEVSMEEMSQRVADVKKLAKKQSGNSFFRDRRPPLGAEIKN